MKFLLVAINAKYIHSNLAVYNLQSYAENRGIEDEDTIEIAEYTINHQKDAILMDIYKQKPDFLAFSCYIWNIEYVTDLIADIAKLLPGIPVWVGGPEVSYRAEDFLQFMPEVTGVMCGEGERTFFELVRHYEEGADGLPLAQIKGIVCRNDKDILRTEAREPMNMDELPFCYTSLEKFENKIIYYETSRGCPFSCSYCLSSIDKKVRFRSFELVKSELQFFMDAKVAQVKFVDRTFNCNHRHAMEIWTYIKEHDNKMTNFHFEIGADLLTEEEIILLNSMRPGLVQLEIGVQSTNERTIEEIRRKMDFDSLKATVGKIASGNNIHQHLDLIAGLPFEDYDSFAQSFCDVYACRPQQLQLGFLKVLSGSYMKEATEKYGLAYKQKAPYEVLFTRWLSYEDVLQLKLVEEMVELYYNSGQYRNTMASLEHEFENAFLMYQELGRFFEKEGKLAVSHSRVACYEMLLSFIVERVPDKAEWYTELLTLDYYLRENAKKRPDFSKNLEQYKEPVKEFYKKEARERKILQNYEQYSGKQMSNMTHMEVFSYPVLEGMLPSEDGNYYLLFDYQKRNPITGEAETVSVKV